MIEPLLISSSLLLGKEMVTQTITKTSKNIYCGLESILKNDNLEFNLVLEKLDINTKLDLINTFINEANDNQKLFSETINKALCYINKILKTIENEIKNINLEITEHDKKWLSKFRVSNCNSMIENLINHIKILDERFNLLIKLIKI